MRFACVSVVVLLCACNSSPRQSPFVDGPPPRTVQDLILNACGNPRDRRTPGADERQLVAVGSSLGKPMGCEADLTWSARDGRITDVEIVGYGDAAWVKSFAESAVLPLLSAEAQDLIRSRLLYKLDGKRAIKERMKVRQGVISIEMTVDPLDSGFTSARLLVVR